jgi:voltage-gated potassium channel
MIKIKQTAATYPLRLLLLVKSPYFILLTVVGNSIIFFFASLFYYLEHDTNPKIQHFIDALWWSFATATTVGYGDITPQSFVGKIMGIFLMLIGTALFATYTALFAQFLLGQEIVREVEDLSHKEKEQMELLKKLMIKINEKEDKI